MVRFVVLTTKDGKAQRFHVDGITRYRGADLGEGAIVVVGAQVFEVAENPSEIDSQIGLLQPSSDDKVVVR
jgi:hypothetical protein